jgi:hypothetical protein
MTCCSYLIVDVITYVTKRDQFTPFYAAKFKSLNYKIVRKVPFPIVIMA